ncbi:MAG TPA: hypothetical protein VF074_21815 [Pyrinomonadaceae bacterium]
MKKHLLRLERKNKRMKGDTAQLAAQLAPLEEQAKRVPKDDDFGGAIRHTVAHQESGAIVVERDSLSVSRDLRQQNKGILGLEPVVFAILFLALAFIGFIAWQITLMP